MKTNRTTKVASILLAATLVTTCFVGGTMAKYTTSGEGSDSARVAKFGVEVNATGDTFAKSYKADDTSFTGAIATVMSQEDVVAPGTKGDMANIKLSGTPEVAVRVTYDADFELGEYWAVNGEYYCPINIKVKDNTGVSYTVNGWNFTDVDTFERAVETVIESYSKEYAPGIDLSGVESDMVDVSWSWAFEGNDDAKDTALGNQAAADKAATMDLTVNTNVTQID